MVLFRYYYLRQKREEGSEDEKSEALDVYVTEKVPPPPIDKTGNDNLGYKIDLETKQVASSLSIQSEITRC